MKYKNKPEPIKALKKQSDGTYRKVLICPICKKEEFLYPVNYYNHVKGCNEDAWGKIANE